MLLFFFCVSLTHLGMSLTLIYSFIFCLLPFFLIHFIFAVSYNVDACVCSGLHVRCASTSIAQNSSVHCKRVRE